MLGVILRKLVTDAVQYCAVSTCISYFILGPEYTGSIPVACWMVCRLLSAFVAVKGQLPPCTEDKNWWSARISHYWGSYVAEIWRMYSTAILHGHVREQQEGIIANAQTLGQWAEWKRSTRMLFRGGRGSVLDWEMNLGRILEFNSRVDSVIERKSKER